MSGNFLRGWGPNTLAIEQAFRSGLLERIEQRFPAIERRRGLTPDELKAQYRDARRPVILEGALSAWPAARTWTFDSLAAVCGDLPVVIDHYSPERTTKTTFADFVARVKHNTGEPLYLQEWHFLKVCPALAGDVGPLEYAAYDFLPRLYGEDFAVRALWIGQRGAVTRLHQDANYPDVIHGQISGTKHWCVMGPDTVLPVTGDNEPDFDALLAPGVDILHGVLGPGDLLYLPAQWWHRVSLLEDSIGIGMPALDERNLFCHMKARLQEFLPMILNQEQIKRDYPDLYQITIARLTAQAKRFDIDLTRIR